MTARGLPLLVAVALLAGTLAPVRYAAPNENFVPVVGPHNGPGARSAPKKTLGSNQPRALPDCRGRAVDWLELSIHQFLEFTEHANARLRR